MIPIINTSLESFKTDKQGHSKRVWLYPHCKKEPKTDIIVQQWKIIKRDGKLSFFAIQLSHKVSCVNLKYQNKGKLLTFLYKKYKVWSLMVKFRSIVNIFYCLIQNYNLCSSKCSSILNYLGGV